MLTDRQQRIKLLARMEAGRRAQPAFLAVLSQALHTEVSASQLLSLPKTDRLMDVYRNGYAGLRDDLAFGYKAIFPPSKIDGLIAVTEGLRNYIDKSEVLSLQMRQSDICGAVVMPVHPILTHWLAMSKLTTMGYTPSQWMSGMASS